MIQISSIQELKKGSPFHRATVKGDTITVTPVDDTANAYLQFQEIALQAMELAEADGRLSIPHLNSDKGGYDIVVIAEAGSL
jgi:hypothetical protein